MATSNVSATSLKNLKPFKKGQSGNPSGKTKLPIELTDVKLLTASELRYRISKLFRLKHVDLADLASDPDTCNIDMAVVKIMLKAINEGDSVKLDVLLNRTIGKVQETMEIVQPEPVIIRRPNGETVELKTGASE